jgi:hypothetical protein
MRWTSCVFAALTLMTCAVVVDTGQASGEPPGCGVQVKLARTTSHGGKAVFTDTCGYSGRVRVKCNYVIPNPSPGGLPATFTSYAYGKAVHNNQTSSTDCGGVPFSVESQVSAQVQLEEGWETIKSI